MDVFHLERSLHRVLGQVPWTNSLDVFLRRILEEGMIGCEERIRGEGTIGREGTIGHERMIGPEGTIGPEGMIGSCLMILSNEPIQET